MTLNLTRVFKKIYQTVKRIVILRGGTRSSKTYSMCQLLTVWLLTGRLRDGEIILTGTASVVRKFKATLQSTVLRDFEEILEKSGAIELVKYNKTKRTFTYQGRMVEFFGADNQQKIRGYKSDILFCNEANELGFKTEFFQLLIRTKKVVFIDFNPSDPYVWINEEIEQKRKAEKGDVDVIVSTYKDNQFLSQVEIDEIEYLETTDEELWQVYGLGQYGKVTGLVFPNVTIIESMPENLNKGGFGLDFGFTNDPTALIEFGFLNRNELYLDERIYSTGLTDDDLESYFKSLGIRRSDEIFADSSEPKSIETQKRKGFNIKAAKKGADSIRWGINTVKRFKIHITARSVNLRKEQRKYKYKQNPDGSYSNIPIDLFNHGWDATRYGVTSKVGKRTTVPKFANPRR